MLPLLCPITAPFPWHPLQLLLLCSHLFPTQCRRICLQRWSWGLVNTFWNRIVRKKCFVCNSGVILGPLWEWISSCDFCEIYLLTWSPTDWYCWDHSGQTREPLQHSPGEPWWSSALKGQWRWWGLHGDSSTSPLFSNPKHTSCERNKKCAVPACYNTRGGNFRFSKLSAECSDNFIFVALARGVISVLKFFWRNREPVLTLDLKWRNCQAKNIKTRNIVASILLPERELDSHQFQDFELQ